MRKFWKRVLKVKYLVALLILIALGIVATVYFTVGLDENFVKLDNIDFKYDETFTNFYGKDSPVFNSDSQTWWVGDEDTKISNPLAKFTEKDGCWYIDDVNTNIKTDMESSKVINENKDYIMFIDEVTTIVTLAVKNSLVDGGDKNNPNDYVIKYTSAQTDGREEKQANLYIGYNSTNLANLNNGTFDTYTKSVAFYNELTGKNDKHYAIKYLDDGVQIYYTVGRFSSTTAYFPEYLYATMYEPAECLYYDEDGNFDKAAYDAAVQEYNDGYLATVKNVANTFEERFRGNVKINSRADLDATVGKIVVNYRTNITVYTQEALEYILDEVFPYLENEGLNVPEYDKEELFEEARKQSGKTKNKDAVEWTLSDVPVELLDSDGEYYNKFFNNENSPLTNNPFILNTHLANVIMNFYTYTKASEKIHYAHYVSNITPGIAASTMYKYFYSTTPSIQISGGKEYEVVKDVDGELVPFVSAGYVARDEEGNAIRDEEGNLVRRLYSLEQVEADNELFGIASEGLAIFKVAIEFRLTDTGMKVSIPRESLVDSTNVEEKVSPDDINYDLIKGDYVITNAQICPYITEVDETQKGYMIIPDGSGAVINFNNNKTSNVSTTYYGRDLTYLNGMKQEESAQLLLGMYAFVNTTENKEGGLIAAIEKGGGQLTVTAGVNTGANRNYAYYQATLRSSENIYTGTVAVPKQFTKFDKSFTPSDIAIDYLVLGKDEIDYASVANKYQKYLIDRYDLEFNDKTDETLNDLTFLGTFEKYSLFLGIKYMTSDTLTTFKQAEEIINELDTNKVKEMSVSYKGWTNENLEYELGGSLKVAKVLGKTASMKSFYNFCVEKGVPFYPELNITTAKGYDYLLGSTRFSSRGAGNEQAIQAEFDLSTGRPNKELKPTYIVSPLYYKSITEKLTSDFAKLNIWKDNAMGGFYLTDLGNKWAGNYRAGRHVYGGDAVLYQQEALAILAQNGKIKIDAPCDYAFKYVDTATSVPVTSKKYAIYDEIIPFYQLVISGLFDYTTEYINGMSNRSPEWYLAKILETGSNVSYLLSAEDPAILLETDYTQYYQAYYQNWKDTIIRFNDEINTVGIHKYRLTDFETVNGLSKVTYTSKAGSGELVLIVNSTNTEKTYTDGTVIPAYGYIRG